MSDRPHKLSLKPRRKKEIAFKKPRRWSHQDDLDAAVGKVVAVESTYGATAVAGLLLASDQFTLKIQVKDKSPLVIFKHAIACFTVVDTNG